jgi:hypothetical protein
MIDITWKGKIGYGDIVSPICYAHNISYKLMTPVRLEFRWKFDSTHKTNPLDPETLWERADYISNLCVKEDTEVTIVHSFEKRMHASHTNYEDYFIAIDKMHNHWYPKQPNQPKTNIIVINSTQGNMMSLKDYGRAWKDPVADHWPDIIQKVKEYHDVAIVDYKTPVVELFDLLRTAKGFIGYHGTAAWPARFMKIPSMIYASSDPLTHLTFFSAFLCKDKDPLTHLDKLDNIFLTARKRIKKYDRVYQDYVPPLIQDLTFTK